MRKTLAYPLLLNQLKGPGNWGEGVQNYFAGEKNLQRYFLLWFLVSNGGLQLTILRKWWILVSQGPAEGGQWGLRGAIWEKWFAAHPSDYLLAKKFLIQLRTHLKPCPDTKWKSVHFSWHTDKPTHIQGVPKNALSEVPFCETRFEDTRPSTASWLLNWQWKAT